MPAVRYCTAVITASDAITACFLALLCTSVVRSRCVSPPLSITSTSSTLRCPTPTRCGRRRSLLSFPLCATRSSVASHGRASLHYYPRPDVCCPGAREGDQVDCATAAARSSRGHHTGGVAALLLWPGFANTSAHSRSPQASLRYRFLVSIFERRVRGAGR